MSAATVSSKGQITLPVSLRKALGLKPGDKVELSTIGNRTILTKAREGNLMKFLGKLPKTSGKPVDRAEIDYVVAEEVAKEYARKVREGKA